MFIAKLLTLTFRSECISLYVVKFALKTKLLVLQICLRNKTVRFKKNSSHSQISYSWRLLRKVQLAGWDLESGIDFRWKWKTIIIVCQKKNPKKYCLVAVSCEWLLVIFYNQAIFPRRVMCVCLVIKAE